MFALEDMLPTYKRDMFEYFIFKMKRKFGKEDKEYMYFSKPSEHEFTIAVNNYLDNIIKREEK